MRVILINPPIDCVLENGNASPVTSYLFYNSAPLGLLYIASTLEAAGHTVSAIDGAAEQLDVAKVTQRVVDFKPDVIGIGSFTVSFETTRRLAEKLKAALEARGLLRGGLGLCEEIFSKSRQRYV